MSFDVEKIRADFPQLTQKVRGRPLVYLDSAATTLKPWPVIERIGQFNSYQVSNVHRGAHFFADQATVFFEETREKVKQFINAKETSEIIFTKGTTESINLVAQTWARINLNPEDQILITEMEHHANIIPWQMICKEKGATLKVIPISDVGELDFDVFTKLMNKKVKLVAVTHCSNHLGTINPIKKISKIVRDHEAVLIVDGAQMVANHPVDVQGLDADFYAFSGHKIFGPFGVGVLYGKRALLEKMPPYQGGGSMISTVSFEETTYNEIPYKFEAGTPNVEAVIALSSAIDYMTKIGFENIEKHETDLLRYATESISQIEGLKKIGTAADKAPILSFVLESCHHSDVAQILDQEGIAVRAGHHCTQPLLKRLQINGSIRASFSIFNTKMDIDKFVKAIIKAKELLV